MRFGLPLLLALTTSAVAQDNVLFLLLDDVGVDMLACYGEGPAAANTPVMDGLAQGGVLFRNVWSAPCCSPTRATVLTGRYGFRTGIGFVVSDNGHDLQADELILPEVFGAGVHAQAGFGKWHLTNQVGNDYHLHPNLSGFDHWVGNWHNLDFPQSYDWWIKTTNGKLTFTDEYATTATVDAFLEWQQQQAGPWFAYVAFHSAHEPFHAPPPHLHTVILPHVDPRYAPLPFYRATVEAMDKEIGRMLAGLGTDLAKTNVIVLGDNGSPRRVSITPFEPEHAKLTPYEGGINVPLIVSGPVVQQGGRECAALVNTTDMFATALELGGYDLSVVLPPGHVHDSVSLEPYLQDPAQAALRSWAFAELWKPNGDLNRQMDYRMLRDERYKIIRTGLDVHQHVFQLYDLETDPFELENLLGTGSVLTAEQQAHYDALRLTLDQLLATG